MAAFCLPRVSLPVLLAPPTFRRFIASPKVLSFSSLEKSRHHGASLQNGSGRLLVRTLSAIVGASSVDEIKSVPVSVAQELLQSGYRYLDVRTPEEFNGGRPVGATNIPYMHKSGIGMAKNPNFLDEVSSVFGKDDKIVVGCQSGKRSFMAATDLVTAGFTGVTDVAGGYAAWLKGRLPTE